VHEFPQANEPDAGYAEALPSYVLEPIKTVLINKLKNSGLFDHVSAFFPYPTDVQMDVYFPHIQMHQPTAEAISWSLNDKVLVQQIEIYYYAKHLQDQGYSSAEISHFVENTVYLIESKKSFNITVGEKTICIKMKGVTSIATDFFVDGSYLISMGLITIEVAFPVCVLQPYDLEEEE